MTMTTQAASGATTSTWPTTLRRLPLALLLAGLLGGCTLAPHYERPAAPVASTYPGADSAKGVAGGTHGTADTGWREFFPDQRLQALIAAALNNNLDLRTAALRIEEARAQYNIQSADRLPTINGNISSSRSSAPLSFISGGKSIINSRYDVGFSLSSFELDFFGRVRSLSDAALAQYLATEQARQTVQISLVAEVAKAYLAERAYAEQLVLAGKTLDARRSTYDLSKIRVEAGASSALDLRQNETLLETARVAQLTLTRQEAQSQNALTLLVGPNPANLPPAQALQQQGIIGDIPAGLPSDLLTRRPDIRAAEQRLIAANANIGAARAAFFPRIAITAGAGTASSTLTGLFDSGSGSWSFAPQLLLPIFDGGRNKANLTLTQVRKNLAIADYEKTIQTAFREVSDALAGRQWLDQQIQSQDALRLAQAERLRLLELRLNNGVASSLDVLDAQRELFNAEQTLVQVRLLRLTNAIDLYRALGGGLMPTGNGGA
jgi:multidrug efflux system outer membrane protein